MKELSIKEKISRINNILLILQNTLDKKEAAKDKPINITTREYYICDIYETLYKGNVLSDIPEMSIVKKIDSTVFWLTDLEDWRIGDTVSAVNTKIMCLELLKVLIKDKKA